MIVIELFGRMLVATLILIFVGLFILSIAFVLVILSDAVEDAEFASKAKKNPKLKRR